VDAATLKKAVDAVKKNVSKGELRNPVLEGILLDGSEGMLIAVEQMVTDWLPVKQT